MDELVLHLTANEVNAVLYSLGKQPYEAVAGLIGKINTQAMAQIQERSQPATADVLPFPGAQGSQDG
jgi:hypothetical protein